MKKLKTKNGDAQKKRSCRKILGVNPEAGMVGKICERGKMSTVLPILLESARVVAVVILGTSVIFLCPHAPKG